MDWAVDWAVFKLWAEAEMAHMMKSNGLGFWGREDELEREETQDPGKRVALHARWIAAGEVAACIDGYRRRKSPAEEEAEDRERRRRRRETTDMTRRKAMDKRKRRDHL